MGTLVLNLLGLVPGAGLVARLVGFLATPAGKLLGVAAIAAALWLGGASHGRRAEAAKCDAAAVRLQLAEAHRDLAVQATTSALVLRQLDELAAVKSTLDKKVRDYEAERSKGGAAACPISGADRRRLLGIRAR